MKEKIIIGFAGESGAGKGTAIEYFKKKFEALDKEVVVLRPSGLLARALNIFVDSNKQDQQWLAIELIKQYGPNIITDAVFREVDDKKKGVFLLDSVRTVANLEEIRKKGGYLIYVTAEPEIRWQRMQQRSERSDDNVSWEKFQEIESSPIEQEIRTIGERADFKTQNKKSYEEFYESLDDIFKKIINL